MPLTHAPPITLHLGAHRTGTTSLQSLLEAHAVPLQQAGVAVWTPDVTRSGMMTGLLGDPGRRPRARDTVANRAAAKVSMRRGLMAQGGVSRLVISDQAVLGGLRENLLLGRLYPSAGARLSRFAQAVPGIDQICLAIRSPDAWWASAVSQLIMRGFAPLDTGTRLAILRSRRGWRNVIEDLAKAAPHARIVVWTHEELAARPADAFALLTGEDAERAAGPATNVAPGLAALRARLADEDCAVELPGVGDTYAPFTPDERAALRAAHARDLTWLREGADGLATFATRRPADAAARDRKGTGYVRHRHTQSALDTAG
ncbi:hypothetical protein [Jannaschia sp. 2305UL9-9]|uniref:hypothetical protein n=1 Tax=Jannaschia sp. 2305UL9-9 TaxID=3121638 RepID=UPI0035292DFF